MSNICSLFNYHHQDVVAYDRGRKIYLKEFLEALIYLDEKIPPYTHLLNLCENRYYFLLALMLGIRRQSKHLFPSNLTEFTKDFLLINYADIFVLNDSDLMLNNCPYINIELALKEKTEKNISDLLDKNEADILDYLFDAISYTSPQLIIFTSGSTGRPQAYSKSLNDFIGVAQQLAQYLKKNISFNKSLFVLATVPAQHMYGLEVSIFMPMVNGLTIHALRPFYPEDIRRLMIASGSKTLLVSTPIHIRACEKIKISLPQLAGCISATSRLDEELAKQFEQRQKILLAEFSLFEIFGCTEIGVIATRKSAQSNYWDCLADITVYADSNENNGALLKSERSIKEFVLNDNISILSAKKFLLHGRMQDMINIGGKRNSLAFLNHHLLSIDVVEDGCFYQPAAEDDKCERLIVFIVVNKKSIMADEIKQVTALIKKHLLLCIDNVFMPRHYYFVASLARNKMGKILHDEMTELYKKSQKNINH